MKKMALFGCILIVFLLLITLFAPSTISQDVITKENKKGRASLAQIYLELDLDSLQTQEILDNFYTFPEGFLMNIDITATDPNQGLNSDFMIAPLVRTLIGDWIGISSYFDPIIPEDEITIHIRLFWGNIVEHPDLGILVVDGWTPLLSWEY